MPFQSEAQRKFMFSQHPEIAEKWAKEGKAYVEKSMDTNDLNNPNVNASEPADIGPVGGEELDFKELAELMIAQGQLTLEEAEEFFGADLDDDGEEYSDPGHQAASGENPSEIEAQKELRYIAQSRMLAMMEPDLMGPLEAATRATISKNLGGACPADNMDVSKGMTPGTVKPVHNWLRRHMTTGGNWKYDYPESTATGKVGPSRSATKVVRPGRKSTASAVHSVSVGGKQYQVLLHTKGDARKLNALREKGRVEK